MNCKRPHEVLFQELIEACERALWIRFLRENQDITPATVIRFCVEGKFKAGETIFFKHGVTGIAEETHLVSGKDVTIALINCYEFRSVYQTLSHEQRYDEAA